MCMFLYLSLISALLFVSDAEQPRQGNPLYVFCDVRNLGGCFSEFRDPMTCSGLNNNKNALIEALPTNRYTTPENADKLIFFSIKNKVETPPSVMSIEDIGLGSVSRQSFGVQISYKNSGFPCATKDGDYKFPCADMPPNICVVKRDEVISRIVPIPGPKGKRLITLMMTSFGSICSAR